MEIVRTLSNREFLIVELFVSLKQEGFDFTILPNVTLMDRQINMSKIYEQTKLLLVPSQWDECFGMVAVEAQINGIPPLVSNRGALPEVIGDGGLVINPPDDALAWIVEIEKIITNG